MHRFFLKYQFNTSKNISNVYLNQQGSSNNDGAHKD